jgi:hypothetical protein
MNGLSLIEGYLVPENPDTSNRPPHPPGGKTKINFFKK